MACSTSRSASTLLYPPRSVWLFSAPAYRREGQPYLNVGWGGKEVHDLANILVQQRTRKSSYRLHLVHIEDAIVLPSVLPDDETTTCHGSPFHL